MPRSIATIHFVPSYLSSERHVEFVTLHTVTLYYFCKVEFIQPSNWLYSVPNLLVFQHLVTLYLGGLVVRVVSEIE